MILLTLKGPLSRATIESRSLLSNLEPTATTIILLNITRCLRHVPGDWSLVVNRLVQGESYTATGRDGNSVCRRAGRVSSNIASKIVGRQIGDRAIVRSVFANILVLRSSLDTVCSQKVEAVYSTRSAPWVA